MKVCLFPSSRFSGFESWVWDVGLEVRELATLATSACRFATRAIETLLGSPEP